MLKIKINYRIFILLFLCLQTPHVAFPQTKTYPIEEWVKKLKVKEDIRGVHVNEVIAALIYKDSVTVFSTLDQMDKKAGSSNKRYLIRTKWIRAYMVYKNIGWSQREHIERLLHEALLESYQADDDMLVADISLMYGEMLQQNGIIELAVMHCLNACDIQDRMGVEKFGGSEFLRYTLGWLLYHTREYQKCIIYTKQAIDLNLEAIGSYLSMNAWNNIGMSHKKLGQYDSAFIAYDHAMKIAKKDSNILWTGIISGNKGQIWFDRQQFDSAKLLLTYDYQTSKQFKLFDNAANSLQSVARINLVEGRNEIALAQLKEAIQLLQHGPNPNYLASTSYALSDVYRALGNSDSSYNYFKLYTYLQDSIDNEVAASQTKIARIKLDNESSIHRIQTLKKEKKAEESKRNFIIAGLVLCALIALLLVNRQRLKMRYRQQLAVQQKLLAESESEAARQQLNLFTQNLIEKTGLIEKLQLQVSNHQLSVEQQRLADTLAHQNILTEEDWQNFKALFEKIYPGFFMTLMEKVPDITIAEQRLAALTRLHLTSKQVASILGISVDSVHKSRQRLRQRLNLTTNDNVEEFIARF